LNAAMELLSGTQSSANDTFAKAQDINGSFIPLPGAPADVLRGAVSGNPGHSYFIHSYYSFTLAQGDNATFTINGVSASIVDFQLFDANQLFVASALTGETNLTKSIRNYVAPTSGTYYLCVNQLSSAEYTVVVMRNLTLESEANDTRDRS